ncbi:MAG: choice-of-anchor B family protein [Acidobacteriota bacterium]
MLSTLGRRAFTFGVRTLCAVAILGSTAALAHGPAPCVDGSAAIYACDRIDLEKHLRLDLLTDDPSPGGNDIWGWTDALDGSEYALMGLRDGVAFVDITDPKTPVVLGHLATRSGESLWRDLKVYADHAFIVSEAGNHGMQVFDLTQLRSVANPPATFAATATYDGFSTAHNIVIDTDSGYAYAVATNTCDAGLHMIDISTPAQPTFAGCHGDDGYTHDAQCVTYDGPDVDHVGKELCIASNADTVTVLDVTDKSNPSVISRTPYAGNAFAHQGWLTEDSRYFLLGDELDESNFGHNTKTYVFDVSDLDAPVLTGFHLHETTAVDHNLYILGDYVYEANYEDGLRILRLGDLSRAEMTEVAWFDTEPGGGSGAWSVYPYFDSGTVIVSDIGQGLFVLRPQLCENPVAPATLNATPDGDGRIALSWPASAPPGGSYSVYRAYGTCPGTGFERVADGLTGTSLVDLVSGQVDYSYVVTALDPTGVCESTVSTCASAQTTGACIAPPAFDGVVSADSAGTSTCGVDLAWDAAAANCGGAVTYSVYKSSDPSFVPSPATRVASGLVGTSWSDGGVVDGLVASYIVRAEDTSNGAEDGNLRRLEVAPAGPLADGTYRADAELGDPVLITGVALADPGAAPPIAPPGAGGDGGPRHPQDGWEITDAQSAAGARSYFSTHLHNSCLSLMTQPLQLTAGTAPQLSFASIFEIEEGWDGGVVQITTDGNSWTTLPLGGGYPGSFIQSDDACGFLQGDPSFTGTDSTWDVYSDDLSSFAGQEVRIRWLYSTDQAAGGPGWWVDAVEVSHVQLPGSCSTPGLVFRDGFESGNTAAWQ